MSPPMPIVIMLVWIVTTALALACYTRWFDGIPDCEPRTVLVLPFILIGDVLTLVARKRTARLLHVMLFACAPELCTPECWQ